MSNFTRRGACAGDKAASLRKLPRKTVSVNWPQIGELVAELTRRLAENRGGNFRPGA